MSDRSTSKELAAGQGMRSEPLLHMWALSGAYLLSLPLVVSVKAMLLLRAIFSGEMRCMYPMSHAPEALFLWTARLRAAQL